MRFIKISKTDLELARAPLNRPVVIIGRSPGCDVVLRANGVRPVHFILEWLGEGEFKPGTGPWSVIEFGPAPVESKEEILGAATGEGVLLEAEFDAQPVLFSGFKFEWVEDRLAETELPGGHVLENVVSEESAGGKARVASIMAANHSNKHPVLESIIVRHESHSVIDVDHLQIRGSRKYTVSHAPLIQVSRAGALVKVMLEKGSVHEILKRGVKVEPTVKGNRELFEMDLSDVVQLRNEDEDMLLRFVPPVAVQMPKREFKTGAIGRQMIIGLILIAVFFGLSRLLPPLAKDEVNKERRLVRVEIKDARPPSAAPIPVATPASTPAPVPTAVPTPASTPVAIATPVPVAKPPQAAQLEAAKEKAPQKSAAKGAQKSGQKSGAKAAKSVDPMDLLSSLQDETGAGGNRVDVDQLVTSGAGPQARAEDGSGIIVRQPPPGVRQSEFSNTTGARGNLSKVSSRLDVDDAIEADAFDAQSDKRSFKADFDGAGGNEFGRGGDGGSGAGGGDATESVRGGLDRASVRRTLASAREAVRDCYNTALAANSKVKGVAAFRWHISPQGTVTSIHLVKSDLKFPMLEGCVQRVIQDLIFEKPKNPIPTTVVYPFKFQKSG